MVLFMLALLKPVCLSAQNLKTQNQKLKVENAALSDSITRLSVSLDSVLYLKKRLTADYDKLLMQSRQAGGMTDSLQKVNQFQTSEIYALRMTTDSLNRRIEGLMTEREALRIQVDSLMALQEHKLKVKKQKELWDRTSWMNISYSPQKIKSDLYRSDMKADWAFGLTFGKTYYLHKAPLADMVRFALNWSYLDLNAAQYSTPYSERIDEEGGSDDGIYGGGYGDYDGGYESDPYADEATSQFKIEAGMQIGPAVIINPVSHLMIQAYFHYAPTYSILLDDDLAYYGAYASFFNVGAVVSYKAIGIGFEGRWGTSTYSQEVYSENIEDYEYRNMKWSTKCARLYLSFRF